MRSGWLWEVWWSCYLVPNTTGVVELELALLRAEEGDEGEEWQEWEADGDQRGQHSEYPGQPPPPHTHTITQTAVSQLCLGFWCWVRDWFPVAWQMLLSTLVLTSALRWREISGWGKLLASSLEITPQNFLRLDCPATACQTSTCLFISGCYLQSRLVPCFLSYLPFEVVARNIIWIRFFPASSHFGGFGIQAIRFLK